MPIHDVGYRPWQGELTPVRGRWKIIAKNGIRLAFRSRWVRRLMFACWLPAIFMGIAFFVVEKVGMEELEKNRAYLNLVEKIEENPELQDEMELEELQEIAERLPDEPFFEPIRTALLSDDPTQIRRSLWSSMMLSFMRYTQGMIALLIVGMIVPPLISQDVRSRAFLVYFSKPIHRVEYMVGKLAVPFFYLFVAVGIPCLIIFFMAVLFSPSIEVLYDTWDIPLRILLATMVIIIPSSCLALMFSSLTQESRIAAFAWFSVWAVGAVAWMVIYVANAVSQAAAQNVDFEDVSFDSQWSLVSLYSTMGKVENWLFGLETSFISVLPSIVTLAAVSIFSLAVLYRQISAPIRA